MAVAEGFEPSHGRINNPVPYQLGYATRELAAATRLELAHPRLQDERSISQLSYAAIWWTGRDSNPHKKFAGLLCCRYITSPGHLSFVIGHFSFAILFPVHAALIESDDRGQGLKMTK